MFKNIFVRRTLSFWLLLVFVFETIFPSITWALSSGPSQPEVQSFEPIGTTDLVDLTSGDFTYNIPLLDVDGYPINISYHSGVNMDQEASWVGLGWNINPGVVNRNMRGLPDDFDGTKDDVVTKKFNQKKDITVGVNPSVLVELFGLDFKTLTAGKSSGGIRIGLDVNYNNYKGMGFGLQISPQFSFTGKSNTKFNLSASLNSSSSNGVTMSQNIGVGWGGGAVDKSQKKLAFGGAYNSRQGLKDLSLSFTKSKSDVKAYKKTYDNGVGSSGTSMDFGGSTYIPSVDFPTRNWGISATFKFGPTIQGMDPLWNIKGYVYWQELAFKQKTYKAYGYFNSHKAVKNSEENEAMHDFNREREGMITVNSPRLPITNYTYDIYSANGQGMGATFRPHRSDVGFLHEPYCGTWSMDGSVGLDFGAGSVFKIGGDIAANIVTKKTSPWYSDNKMESKTKFLGETVNNLYEPYYFKEFGDLSVDNDEQFYKGLLEDDAVYAEVSKGRFGMSLKNNLKGIYKDRRENNQQVTYSSRSNNNMGQIKRAKRRKRNQNFSFLTIDEASKFGLEPSLYTKAQYPKKRHHMGELTALRSDGSRYIYGIPAYNTYQEEVTFAIGDLGEKRKGTGSDGMDKTTGTVKYKANEDNSIDNSRGLDNYFSSTETPEFAHSYLLTAVLSSDYIDNDGVDGPTAGDMGNYTKFKYQKWSGAYNWRTPMGENLATIEEGMRSNSKDDKANYVYGKKELWYVDEIITKNYVAVFNKSIREDGLGVKDRNGKIDATQPNRVLKLDNIKLYSIIEYNKSKDNTGYVPVPLKTVHFEYDYSLCEGIPNNEHVTSPNTVSTLATKIGDAGYKNATSGTGKLTLKRIFFTYQNSEKERFSPYEFTYADFDPDYNSKNIDRWGNYKPFPNSSSPDFRDIAEYPFTEQLDYKLASQALKDQKERIDQYTYAWTLTKIQLPSGGDIQIEYESDDYAYVQDKRAQQMFKILEMSKYGSPTQGNVSSTNTLYQDALQFRNIIIELPYPVKDQAELEKRYFEHLDQLYFNFLVDLDKGHYEHITGFSGIQSYGCHAKDPVTQLYTSAYIEMKFVDIAQRAGSKDVSPIFKSAAEFCRSAAPDIAYDSPEVGDPDKNGVESVLTKLAGMFTSYKEMFSSPDQNILNSDKCRFFNRGASYVKLNNPDFKKLGGGTRVKKIVMNDRANVNGIDEVNSSYGQTYVYNIEKSNIIVNGQEQVISSGVASYEPIYGGEEIPQREPIKYNKNREEKILKSDDEPSTIDPIGESFFPSPSIVYSRVVVKDIYPESAKKHGTGYVVSEFFTAKDFPTRFIPTDVQVNYNKPKLFNLLKIKTIDHLDASQGYSIVVNDMPGKQKAKSVFNEFGKQISSVRYYYKTQKDRPSDLDNTVAVINKEGILEPALVGVETDLIFDTSENEFRSYSPGVQINLNNLYMIFFILPIPGVLPSYSSDDQRLRTCVATKVISKVGLLDRVEADDLGSKIVTYNRAYDSETGQVLITEVQNEFDDPVFNTTYPSHWAYERMGQAYKNIGLRLRMVLDNGQLSSTKNDATTKDFIYNNLVVGDEMYLDEPETPLNKDYINFRFYVTEKYETESGKYLTLLGGDPRDNSKRCRIALDGLFNFKIIRSGRRNMQSLTIMNVSSLTNPIKNLIKAADGSYLSGDLKFNVSDEVLQASAVEYNDYWAYDCRRYTVTEGYDNFINPIYEGVRGNFRSFKSYAFLTERNKTNTNGRRKDGYYRFSPFWGVNDDGAFVKTPASWQVSNEVTTVNQYSGAESEVKDPLGRHSAALFGHNDTRQNASGINAKENELFFENFEDEESRPYYENKFTNVEKSTDAHTGKTAVKVKANTGNARMDINKCCENGE